VLRRLIKASAIVAGVAAFCLAAAACSPVKLGAAAIVGNQRITIAALDTEVTNLSQAAAKYPTQVNLNASQRTQATLTWLIRYQITEELARQQGITISAAQGQAALNQAVNGAISSATQQGLTNATQTLILAASGIPPNTSDELGRYEAISNRYLAIANGGTLPASGSAAATAAGNKLSHAECLAAKALNNAVAIAVASAEQQGVTNASQNLILAASGIPPNTSGELGRYEAIANQYLAIANGGTAPAAGSAAQTAAGNKLNQAECQAAKALNIAVNPQFGQLDYNGYQVVPAPSPVTRTQGPVKAASPVATAPAC